VQCGQSDACAASTAAEGPTAEPGEQPAAASLLPDAAGHLSRTLSPQCAPFSPIPHAGNNLTNPTEDEYVLLEGVLSPSRDRNIKATVMTKHSLKLRSKRAYYKIKDMGFPVFVLD